MLGSRTYYKYSSEMSYELFSLIITDEIITDRIENLTSYYYWRNHHKSNWKFNNVKRNVFKVLHKSKCSNRHHRLTDCESQSWI